MKRKIALIVPYFSTGGGMPPYLALWLKTCYKAKDYADFFIFTDEDINVELPENCFVYNYTLTQIKTDIEKIVGFSVKLKYPYKLCDFKPMYGLIFKDYLVGYSYWGYCDMDVIWGDFNILNKLKFYRYDKIFERGHLTIFRNNDKCNKLFYKNGGLSYKTVFTSNKIFCFDEFFGMNIKQIRFNIRCLLKKPYADIIYDGSEYVGKFPYPDNYKLLAVGIKNYESQVFYYERGKVFQAYIKNNGKVECKELLYIHLQKRKYSDYQIGIENDSFYILSNGLVVKNKDGLPTREEILNLMPEKDSKKDEILKDKSYTYLYKNSNFFMNYKIVMLLKYIFKTRRKVKALQKEN